MIVTQDRSRSKMTRPPTRASRSKRAADQPVEAESLQSSRTETVRCSLCARDAHYATVYKAGRIYCSIECAEAVPGLYFG